MIKHATGAQFEIVSGYKGPPDLFLAMSRGEIDGVCGLDWTALKSQQPEWLRDRKLNILVQASIEPHPELAKLGVPVPWPYIKDETDRRAVEVMVGFEQAFGKSYLVPPETPAERVRSCARRSRRCSRTRSSWPRPTRCASRSPRNRARRCSGWCENAYASTPA